MEAKVNERPIPDAAVRDPNSVEILRVWIAESGLHCSLKVGMYHETSATPESQAWGKILADVTRHIAAALESGYSMNKGQVQNEIRTEYLKELDNPTSEAMGDFVNRVVE